MRSCSNYTPQSAQHKLKCSALPLVYMLDFADRIPFELQAYSLSATQQADYQHQNVTLQHNRKFILKRSKGCIHAIKTCDREGVFTFILNLDARWSSVVRFTPRLLYSLGKNPQYQLDKRVGSAQGWRGKYIDPAGSEMVPRLPSLHPNHYSHNAVPAYLSSEWRVYISRPKNAFRSLHLPPWQVRVSVLGLKLGMFLGPTKSSPQVMTSLFVPQYEERRVLAFNYF